MYHSNIVAYEQTPTRERIDQLSNEGYTIYIDNNKRLNEELQTLNNVKYLKITGHNTVDDAISPYLRSIQYSH